MVLSTQELASQYTEMFAVTGTYRAGGVALTDAEFLCSLAEKNHTPIPADGYNGYSCSAFGSY